MKTKIASRSARRGGMSVVMTGILVSLSMFCMLTVNTVYLEMARTDLQTATDLSVKAATLELGETQNYSLAQQMLDRQLNRHRVGNSGSITLDATNSGTVLKENNGRFKLDKSGSTTNAIQVETSYPALFGNSLLPFSHLGNNSLKITTTATAARTDVDLVLCIDRSASMAWGLTNEPFRYPNGTKGLDNYYRAPDATGSRWAAVVEATNALNDIITERRNEDDVRIGLVTFASEYRFGIFEATRVSVDRNLTPGKGAITSALQNIGKKPLIGGTDIQAGLSNVEACRNQGAKRGLTASKVAVLLTDGLYTDSVSPLGEANRLAAAGWQIYTISFSEQADQQLMQEIASVSHGTHFHATDRASLVEAFQTIAYSLPGTLIN